MWNLLKKIQRKWLYSLVGFWTVLKEEKSIWAYLTFIPILVGIGIWVDLSMTQWSIVIVISTLVISIEVLNTALEAAVDTISFQYNVKVKKIKDIASAATLIITLGAIVGILLIYVPAIQGAI